MLRRRRLAKQKSMMSRGPSRRSALAYNKRKLRLRRHVQFHLFGN